MPGDDSVMPYAIVISGRCISVITRRISGSGTERAGHHAGAQRRQVVAREIRALELGDEHRRHAVERGAAFAMDGLEHLLRVERHDRAEAGAVRERAEQVHGAYTFYVDGLLGGNHQFKAGGEVQHETGRTVWGQLLRGQRGPALQQRRRRLGAPGTAGRLAERAAQLRAVPERQLPARQADREHAHQLHPSKLEMLGLVAAIHGLCRDTMRHYGVKVDFESCDVPRDVGRTWPCAFTGSFRKPCRTS